MIQVQVKAEYSPLRKVVVATPGNEKTRLTPKTLYELQYAEIPDPVELKLEHDEFVKKLRENGAEVINLREEVMKLKEEELVALIKSSSECDILLDNLDKELMAEILISGLTAKEAKEMGANVLIPENEEFCVKPLVNIMFTRDPGMVLGGTYVSGKMRWESRRREPEIFTAILKPKNVLKVEKGFFEGGDFFPLDGRLLMGFGTRSSGLGLSYTVPKLMESGEIDEAILVKLDTPELHPNKGIGHLDTVMGIPAQDVIVYYKSLLDKSSVYLYKGKEIVRDNRVLSEVMKDYLGHDLRIVNIGNAEYYAEEREHWLLASNIIVVGKNKIIAYEHNRLTNRLMTEAGIEIITFKGNEIIKEGGERSGPRCMTLPLQKY
ncbi:MULTISPECIES: arginine deiminase family protein [Metallosphaera]|uniref:Arginine deiminase n=4 Tax=Metallosphaera TaxID=41980 RepID=A4YF44_METS5|nr:MULTISPECIES: arginine deiminase family protein [Metallosphaera]ABP95046.1 arginine deiminase [Metallosphaera sedula DSM 5348]AIM27032.1 arginine deiminase [Metallosphaera sedula]AKV73950.1 arginine deiminase [Metallosphaera sedula]AKV76189.1 arginine deiminase [Metallosphaera sedula]AKV78441.1 arginine deiminase [Metallosphaera sedula]